MRRSTCGWSTTLPARRRWPRWRAPPHVHTIRNARNLGYAGSNNVGIQAALDAGAAWVLVLNNDARLRPDTIDELVAVARRDPTIAAVGAKILRLEDPSRL